jgi:hypothetical protein
LAARLAGIEPTFGSNPLQPAPLLDFAKASKFKKVKKWMTKVDNIRRQVYANPRPAILASKMMQELGAPLLAIK